MEHLDYSAPQRACNECFQRLTNSATETIVTSQTKTAAATAPISATVTSLKDSGGGLSKNNQNKSIPVEEVTVGINDKNHSERPQHPKTCSSLFPDAEDYDSQVCVLIFSVLFSLK